MHLKTRNGGWLCGERCVDGLSTDCFAGERLHSGKSMGLVIKGYDKDPTRMKTNI